MSVLPVGSCFCSRVLKEEWPCHNRNDQPGGIVYLAAPYSHPDPAVMIDRFHAVNRAAGRLMADRGWVVFSPISHSHSIAADYKLPRTWNWWRHQDMAFMAMCVRLVVLQLDGWAKSVGVRAEIEYAQKHGITTQYLGAEFAEPRG